MRDARELDLLVPRPRRLPPRGAYCRDNRKHRDTIRLLQGDGSGTGTHGAQRNRLLGRYVVVSPANGPLGSPRIAGDAEAIVNLRGVVASSERVSGEREESGDFVDRMRPDLLGLLLWCWDEKTRHSADGSRDRRGKDVGNVFVKDGERRDES